jgi:hypothetical protein
MQVSCQAPLSQAFAQVLSLLGEEPPTNHSQETEAESHPPDQEEENTPPYGFTVPKAG